jgi:hypothetical protein
MKVTYSKGLWVGLGFFLWLLAAPTGRAAEVAKSPHGPNDEIGALNTLTAAQSLAVLQRVDSGKVYDLGVDYFVGMPGLADLGMGDPAYHWRCRYGRRRRSSQ